MNYTVKIGEKTFTVEIEDINKRPVVARVDGQVFEVTPELAQTNLTPAEVSAQPATLARPLTASAQSSNTLTAPLPGTVIEVFVHAGDMVESGQVVLIIEAMKMKNSIRSVRDGVISAVLVSPAQTVAHKQVLLEYAE